MTRWWIRSVRVQLGLWYTASLIVVLGMYASVVYVSVSRQASESLNERIRGDFLWAAAMVDQRPDGSITWYDDDSGLGHDERPWLQVWSPEGHLLYRNLEAERKPVPESRGLALQRDPGIVAVRTPETRIRILSRTGQVANRRVVLQVARLENTMRQQLQQLALILVLGLPVAAVAASLGGYVLARRVLVPIDRMAQRARQITADRLSERLPVDNPNDEMGRLAGVFNETLGRLEASFGQMRRFTADVSHQLRTPLTAIRSVGEVGLREKRDAHAYQNIISSMLEEVDRLVDLVNRLLMLSRSETTQVGPHAERVDVVKLAEEVVSHLSVLAEENGQTLVVDSQAPAITRGDRLVLRQALINLMHNAIKYSPANGRICIRVADAANRVIVDVIDNGSGVAADLQPRIFERFYSDDESSPGETAGSGLGLSIAKSAIEAHGGQLTLERSDATGSTFRMVLPRLKHTAIAAAG